MIFFRNFDYFLSGLAFLKIEVKEPAHAPELRFIWFWSLNLNDFHGSKNWHEFSPHFSFDFCDFWRKDRVGLRLNYQSQKSSCVGTHKHNKKWINSDAVGMNWWISFTKISLRVPIHAPPFPVFKNLPYFTWSTRDEDDFWSFWHIFRIPQGCNE